MLCTLNALTVNMLCSDIALYDFTIACIVSYLHNIYYCLKYYYFESFAVTVKAYFFSDEDLKKWVENVQFLNKNAINFKFAGDCNFIL